MAKRDRNTVGKVKVGQTRDIGSYIQVYGTWYKVAVDGGWGCGGCALKGRCQNVRDVIGECDGNKRTDGEMVIFNLVGKHKVTAVRVCKELK